MDTVVIMFVNYGQEQAKTLAKTSRSLLPLAGLRGGLGIQESSMIAAAVTLKPMDSGSTSERKSCNDGKAGAVRSFPQGNATGSPLEPALIFALGLIDDVYSALTRDLEERCKVLLRKKDRMMDQLR